MYTRLVKISDVYESYGFDALDTSAFEYADALGKFLPDADRPNEGVFALEDDDKQWLSLRYDLTAPLARYVAENYDGLPKPFRRFQWGPVWRNEKPGPGRAGPPPAPPPQNLHVPSSTKFVGCAHDRIVP